MKHRYAAWIMLLGWTLFYGNGKTLPKNCENCAYTLESWGSYGGTYQTLAECEQARRKVIADFAKKAEAKGEYVAAPLDASCSQGTAHFR